MVSPQLCSPSPLAGPAACGEGSTLMLPSGSTRLPGWPGVPFLPGLLPSPRLGLDLSGQCGFCARGARELRSECPPPGGCWGEPRTLPREEELLNLCPATRPRGPPPPRRLLCSSLY